MPQVDRQAVEIQNTTGLKPTHFADFIRVAQLIFDPSGGVSGRIMPVKWKDFGISAKVEENMKSLGMKYQYASPHLPIQIIWEQLNSETRNWFIENKDNLRSIEECFPALDED